MAARAAALISSAKPATEGRESKQEGMRMATYSVNAVEVFGRGVLKSEGVVVDKENDVSGGGRNAIMYKSAQTAR